MLADALLDAVAFLLDGLGIAHVAIGLCLHPHRIVFEVLVCPDARFEVDCIVLQVFWRCVAYDGVSAQGPRLMTRNAYLPSCQRQRC